MSELTRDQQEYVDRLASVHGSTLVLPLPDHSTVAVCGWHPDGGGPDGRRVGPWEWLHADGARGLVDGAERFPALQRSQWDSAYAELASRIDAAVAKRASQGLPTCGHAVPDLRKLSALMEEVGEAARVFQDGESPERLQDELYDVAVAATLWAGSLNKLVRPDRQRLITRITETP